MKFGSRKARARDNRVEIAGQKSRGLAQTPDAHGLKVLLKEGASGFRILRLQVRGLAADVR
jgi:L-2-hydroxyglutarate oxidase LhgO